MTNGLPQRKRHGRELEAEEVTVRVQLAIRAQGQAEEESVTVYTRCRRHQAEEIIRQLAQKVRTDLRAI
jgi:hypothetical protein